MSDERLTGLLGSLRFERMDRIADDRTRERLEAAWRERAERRTWAHRLRRLAPVVATLVLLAGLGAATLRASGDSLLYGLRVTVEDAAAALYADPQDRVQYLMSLFDERQSEAARLEATGNALAAVRVRQAEASTLREIQALLPEAPDVTPVVAEPTPTPTASPSPTPTLSPTPSPTASASPVPTTPRPTPTRTPTPRPATASPAPTGTPMPVTLTGRVKNPDLSLASNVCVRLDPTSPTCLAVTGATGTYSIAASARLDQTVTLYFTRQDGTTLLKAYASAIVRGSTVQLPDAKLAP